MRLFRLAAVLVALPIAGAAAQTPTRIVATVTTDGIAAADSGQLVSIVRSALQRDSLFRIVYRPPRDSMHLVAGRVLEVARLVVTATAKQTPRGVLVDIGAIDVTSGRRVVQAMFVTTPDEASRREEVVTAKIREFAQRLATATR